MTEEEHIALVEAGNVFCQDLAKIAAKAISQFSEDIRGDVVYYLQDHTSLFSPYTADLIIAELKK